MHYYLRQHPEIYMSVPKEPFYFASDLDSHQLKTQDRDEYLSFFKDASSEKRVGESTVWYLYSEKAPNEIKNFSPDSKIIIMLRNPIDAMHAMHSQFRFSGNEPIEDFEQAVKVEPRRRRKQNIDPGVYFLEGLLYRKVFAYYNQVKRYLDRFGSDRIKIILLRDLKNDPKKCYKNVLDFLGVGEYLPSTFKPHNSNCRLKSDVLREIVKQFPGRTLGTLRDFVPVKSCAGLWEHVKPFLVDNLNRNPIDPAFREELIEDFRSDIRNLESLIDRDLSSWLSLKKPSGHVDKEEPEHSAV